MLRITLNGDTRAWWAITAGRTGEFPLVGNAKWTKGIGAVVAPQDVTKIVSIDASEGELDAILRLFDNIRKPHPLTCKNFVWYGEEAHTIVANLEHLAAL